MLGTENIKEEERDDFPEKLLNCILKNEWSYEKEDGGLKMRKHSIFKSLKVS